MDIRQRPLSARISRRLFACTMSYGNNLLIASVASCGQYSSCGCSNGPWPRIGKSPASSTGRTDVVADRPSEPMAKQKPCAQCGAIFVGNLARLFCSRDCRYGASRDRRSASITEVSRGERDSRLAALVAAADLADRRRGALTAQASRSARTLTREERSDIEAAERACRLAHAAVANWRARSRP